MRTGTNYSDTGSCEFTLWAPFAEKAELRIIEPVKKTIPVKKDVRGYWKVTAEDIHPEASYVYRINGQTERPDPASHYQPKGIYGPSQIIDHRAFQWHDSGWSGIPLQAMIMYEIHTGAFTPEGTFNAIISRIDELKQTGINAIEIMPVSQFPGERNWGYDGVYIYAVQNSYGGPEGLKILVDECHKRGVAVILDVVYNHLGPEGNYLRDFGPYFTDRYKTPWGEAINFDGPYSNDVRNFFINNALYWFENFHIDALRIDAVHSIFDMGARHFLRELSETVENYSADTGWKRYLIAESDLNDVRVIQPREKGGHGLDGHWCDDFHHSLHALLTGESKGYYIDFGRTEHMAKSIREGFVYSGQFSEFRKRNHGNSSKEMPPDHFVVFAQNHDQTGNRMNGERLSSMVSFESLKLTAGLVLLSPYIPLLFMGEEYGETAPFLYFVSHSDKGLVKAVREGRKKEFSLFRWDKEPPDPQDPGTFLKCRINWNSRNEGNGKILLELYRELIRMRKEIPALANLDRDCIDVKFDEAKKTVIIIRWKDGDSILMLFNFAKHDTGVKPEQYMSGYRKILDSSDNSWNGPGTVLPEKIGSDKDLLMRKTSFAVYSGITTR